jgi:hypothetical protein
VVGLGEGDAGEAERQVYSRLGPLTAEPRACCRIRAIPKPFWFFLTLPLPCPPCLGILKAPNVTTWLGEMRWGKKCLRWCQVCAMRM